MSLNEDLILTIEMDNLDEIKKAMDDLQKKVSKSSPSEVSAEVKTAKAVEKTVSAKEEALRITKDISNFNNKELRDANESMKQKKLESKILNDHMDIVGDTGKVWKVSLNEQTGMYERLLEDKKDVNTESDKEGRKLDTLIRKYRWFQSFLLVTQNFIGMMGKSVKAFGSAMKLLTAPFILFLNLLLIPILPLLADLSKWLMDIVQGYKDWSEENETLAGIIGGVAFTSILGFMGLALAAWVWDVIKKVGKLITKIPLIGPKFKSTFEKVKGYGTSLKTSLVKSFNAIKTSISNIISKITGNGGLNSSIAGVKTPKPPKPPTTPPGGVAPVSKLSKAGLVTGLSFLGQVGVAIAALDLLKYTQQWGKQQKEEGIAEGDTRKVEVGAGIELGLWAAASTPVGRPFKAYGAVLDKIMPGKSITGEILGGSVSGAAQQNQENVVNINIGQVTADNPVDFANSLDSYYTLKGTTLGVYS